MVVFRPRNCPQNWAFWLLASRVKSGMLSDRVAQKPTMAVRPGKKAFQKSCRVANWSGCDSMGPKPSALCQAHPSRARPIRMSSGAPQFSTRRMLSMPRQKMATLMNQKKRKQANCATLTWMWSLLKKPITAASAKPGHCSSSSL